MNKEYKNWSIDKGDYHRHGEKEKSFISKLIKHVSRYSKLILFILLIILISYILIKFNS